MGDTVTTVMHGTPVCETCGTGVGWTRLIRMREAGRKVECWVCVFAPRIGRRVRR